VLHGCKQTAATFARDAGWLALAERSRVALLLPEQKGLPSFLHDIFLFPWVVALWGANNQNACFNWFEPDDTSRDHGGGVADANESPSHNLQVGRVAEMKDAR
jgi:poly(3-hydroxybutyrate) depolymerase